MPHEEVGEDRDEENDNSSGYPFDIVVEKEVAEAKSPDRKEDFKLNQAAKVGKAKREDEESAPHIDFAMNPKAHHSEDEGEECTEFDHSLRLRDF